MAKAPIKKPILKSLTFVQKAKILVPQTPALALRSVISKDKQKIYASSDTVYRGALFGRDSIEVAEDLIHLRPKLVRNVILTLASLQGEEINKLTEEEPGKIIHEYRSSVVDGKHISGVSLKIYHELAEKWGTDNGNVAFYASIDSTPLFIRLVCLYCQLYGSHILQNKVTLRSGHRLSMALVIENSLDWLVNKIENSKSGLLEYQRMNPKGFPNQTWKDSEEFYVHENGEMANHNRPISSIELQGLAYDALMLAAELLDNKAEKYRELAKQLRDKTLGQAPQSQTSRSMRVEVASKISKDPSSPSINLRGNTLRIFSGHPGLAQEFCSPILAIVTSLLRLTILYFLRTAIALALAFERSTRKKRATERSVLKYGE